MAAFIKAIDNLKDQYSASVLLVHHTGHSEKDRARGSSVIKAALDVEYRFDKKGDAITFTCTKMKDAEECDPKIFELQQILVDMNGFPEKAAVLVSTNKQPIIKLSPQTGKAWQILRERKLPISSEVFMNLLVNENVIKAKPRNVTRIFKRIIKELSDEIGLSELKQYLNDLDKTDKPRTKLGQGGQGGQDGMS
jgi:hypothetical protein